MYCRYSALLAGIVIATAMFVVPAFANVTNAFDNADVPRIAVAGKLMIDVHPDIMLTVTDNGKVVNWFNAGYLWGTFGDFGFDGPPEQYPDCTVVDGNKAVSFDGSTWLRGDMRATQDITGSNDFSIEVWAYNPTSEKGECLVSWADNGGALLYPASEQFGTKPATWQHIVLVYADGREQWYVDGELKADEAASHNLSTNGFFFLGSMPDGSRKYSGSLGAVRVHRDAMTEEQIKRNFAGGQDLGTVLLVNIDPNQPRDATWGYHTNDALSAWFSKHFRTMWEPAKDENGVMTDEKVRNQLEEYEEIYNFYTTLGMHPPIVSANKEQRGDGIKYKINICNNWDGGAFGGYNGALGCGYPIHAPGITHAHELGHAYQTQQMGAFPGNFWETHTSWMSKKFENRGKLFNYGYGAANFFVSNGRNYYGSFHIFEQLLLNPEYGALFIARMWHNGKRDKDGTPPFLWQIAETIDPDPSTTLADEWVKMARRQITWDYPDALKVKGTPDTHRFDRTLLEPIPYQPGWWRSPKEWAPQQFGFNICPLDPKEKTITVDFQGYKNSERGSDWRVCLVAVNTSNEPRYSTIWNEGVNSITLNDDEHELYLAVAGTPSTIMAINMTGDFRSPEQHQFPYCVALQGAEPKDTALPEQSAQKGHRHANGGGFVAATANVDETAYVGQRAQVLDTASVLGQARIEDYAVVQDKATVQDHAILSGHAIARGSAIVKNYARLRDFATAEGSTIVKDHARILEHGTSVGKLSGYATVKGFAHTRGAKVYGTSILDGGYTKENEISNGVWFTWSWGAGQNPGERYFELGGLYAQYLFETNHPYLAWDTHGITWGYLVGSPTVSNGWLVLNGKNQFVDMPKDVGDMRDMTIELRLEWNGGAPNQRIVAFAADADNCVYLTPADKDSLPAFVIRKDGNEQILKADKPLPQGKPVNIKLTLSENLGELYVNGKKAAENPAISLNPEDIRPTACYLGRGYDGNYFSGKINSFSLYSIVQIDKAGPEPNPAAWLIPPVMYCDTKTIMYAETGCDPLPGIEYFFTEVKGGTGHTSGWQTEPVYEDRGLEPGKTYSYTVKMRDALGNETKPSEAVEVTWKPKIVFMPVENAPDGATMFVFEAEHHQFNTACDHHRWRLLQVPDGYSGEGVLYATPEAGQPITDVMLQSPRLDYYLKIKKAGKYYVWVRGGGRYYYSNTIMLGMDGTGTQILDTGWRDLKYRWKAAAKPYDIQAPGTHTLSIWMDRDAALIDRIIVTSLTPDEYQPTAEKDLNGDLVGKGPQGESAKEFKNLPARELVTNLVDYRQPSKFRKRNESSVFVEGEDGLIVIEAEHWNGNAESFAGHAECLIGNNWNLRTNSVVLTPDSFQNWAKDRNNERYGGEGYMQATPVDGAGLLITNLAHKARLDYNVEFTQPGLHYIWVRGQGVHWLSDTVRVGLDGKSEPWGKDIGLWWTGWRWVPSKAFMIDKPGIHTVSIWMDEDGTAVDKLLITNDKDFRPSSDGGGPDAIPTGLGPEETERRQR